MVEANGSFRNRKIDDVIINRFTDLVKKKNGCGVYNYSKITG